MNLSTLSFRSFFPSFHFLYSVYTNANTGTFCENSSRLKADNFPI